MTYLTTDAIALVRAHLLKRGVTATALAEAAGIHRNTLSGVFTADWNPTVATLISLERAIKETEK